jgi:hypothetical protein
MRSSGLVAVLTTAFVLLPELSQAEDQKEERVANAAATGTITAENNRNGAKGSDHLKIDELNSELNALVKKNKKQAELLEASRKQETELREKIKKASVSTRASKDSAPNKPKKPPQAKHQDDFSTYQSQLLKNLGYSQETKPVAPKAAASDGCTTQPLFIRSDPLDTPIAKKLRAHFMRGGSIADAIRLVEMEELATAPIARKQRHGQGRGSRLPPDWKPSTSEIAYAVDRGMRLEQVQVEAEKFRNYWIAKAGVNATKRDWSATWRNWIITAMERNYGADGQRGFGLRTPDSPRRPPTRSDTVLAAMGRLAQHLDERRGTAVHQGRQVPDHTDPAGGCDAQSGTARNP